MKLETKYCGKQSTAMCRVRVTDVQGLRVVDWTIVAQDYADQNSYRANLGAMLDAAEAIVERGR